MPTPATARRRTSYRRALSLALAGAIGLSSPALAADLDEIRDRIDEVEEQSGRTAEEKAAVARAIDAACTEVGFIQILGHGIPPEIQQGLAAAMTQWATPWAARVASSCSAVNS